MNGLIIRIIAVAALLVSMLVWLYGGAQTGFYKTYYTVTHVDVVTEIQYQEQVDAFLPGIESLAIGFALFFFLIVLGSLLESRTRRSESTDQHQRNPI